MLSVHAGWSIDYHLSASGGNAGAVGYYMDAGEPAGFWAGRGATDLGLRGQVDPEIAKRVFDRDQMPDGTPFKAQKRGNYQGMNDQVDDRAREAVAAYLADHPHAVASELDRVRARALKATRNAVPFFDWTFSFTKSVSVLQAAELSAAKRDRLAGVEQSAHAKRAEQLEAVARDAGAWVVEEIERTAAFTRTGRHGGKQGEYRDARGVIAAVFVQHTSREGDPQLHAHVTVANRVQRADQADTKYRTLHSRKLMQERLRIAAVVNRRVAQRLAQLGYVMKVREDLNDQEIGGVSSEVMDMFSARRVQVTGKLRELFEAYERKHGHAPNRRALWLMKQEATLKSRDTKAESHRAAGSESDAPETVDQRLDAWEAKCERRELKALAEVAEAVATYSLDHANPVELTQAEAERAARVAVAEVQRQNSQWTLSQLAFELSRALPPLPATLDPGPLMDRLIRRVLLGLVADADVVQLGPAPELLDVTELGVRASDRESIYTAPEAGRFATVGQLDMEEELLAEARRRIKARITPEEASLDLLDTDLDPGQREAAQGLLTADRQIVVLVGPAGAGKSHVMATVARVHTARTGRRVIGLSSSENASRVLAGEMSGQVADKSLVDTFNIAAFLGKIKGSGRLRYPVPVFPGDIVVIDEASQVPTLDLIRVSNYVRQNGARMILTGDIAQLGAVEAGGVMKLIAHDQGYWELQEVRRFNAEWERTESLRVREGDIGAIPEYQAYGRIRSGPEDVTYRVAVDSWVTDFMAGRNVLLLAGSNAEAADLAAMARQELIKAGAVDKGHQITLSDQNDAGIGDWIRARLNTHIDADGRRLTNRDTLRILEWTGVGDLRQATVERKTSSGWSDKFSVPAKYLRDNAELAYAGNVHVAQGATVDTSHLLVSETLSREALYVGLTRGRESNMMHVVTGPSRAFDKDGTMQAPAERVIGQAMSKEQSSLSATEVMRELQDIAADTRHLFQMWKRTVQEKAEAKIDSMIQSRVDAAEFGRYKNEPQRRVLLTALRERWIHGADVEATVDQVTADNLNGASSVSAVLHSRLEAVPWARAETTSWTDRTPEADTEELGTQIAGLMDDRQTALGEKLAAKPEPWLVRHLGMPPKHSEALMADYVSRAGRAAAYREAAGIDGQDVSIGSAPKGDPEMRAAWESAAGAMELVDVEMSVRQMDTGQLEAIEHKWTVQAQYAPPDVRRELEATNRAEQNTRLRANHYKTEGNEALAGQAEALADEQSLRSTVLGGVHEVRSRWEESTKEQRADADRASLELNRRREGDIPKAPDADWLAQFEKDVAGLERAIDRERMAAMAEGKPWPPRPEKKTEAESEPESERDRLADYVTRAQEAAARLDREEAHRDTERAETVRRDREREAEALSSGTWQAGSEGSSWRDAEAEAGAGFDYPSDE